MRTLRIALATTAVAAISVVAVAVPAGASFRTNPRIGFHGVTLNPRIGFHVPHK